MNHLLERAPVRFGAYHEAFVGGGAFFFGLTRAGRLNNKPVFLTDINQELIDCYSELRDNVEGVIRSLSKHPHSQEHFYRTRALDPFELSPAERAARMIFLNRTCFNGLYRVNRSGAFNVPFGRYKNPRICDEENLRAVSRALQGVEILCSPFSGVVERAEPGDLVYFDPPYVPASSTANFVSYAKDGFGPKEQEDLARTFEALVDRGVHVMLSNSDTSFVRTRYGSFFQLAVSARRNVNSDSSRRGPVGELIVTSYNPQLRSSLPAPSRRQVRR